MKLIVGRWVNDSSQRLMNAIAEEETSLIEAGELYTFTAIKGQISEPAIIVAEKQLQPTESGYERRRVICIF